MGMKFVKNADDGEIYLLPDKTEAVKNSPPFMDDVSENFDKVKSYADNVIIADLTEQLKIKDKQLKNATKEVVTVDKSTLITCFVILGIVIILIATFAFASLKNNMPLPQNLSEQAVTAEIPIAEKMINDETETKANSYDDINSVYVDEPKKQETGLNDDIDFISEITNFFGNSVLAVIVIIVPAFISLRIFVGIFRGMGR